MKLVSYNINGIRASVGKGILDYIDTFNADVYAFQEVRANEQVTRTIFNDGQVSLFETANTNSKYFKTYNCGDVAGYAGTMVLSKEKPIKVDYDMGSIWHDNEGRTTTCHFEKFILVNAYIPNGNSRLDFKMQYLSALTKWMETLKGDKPVIVVGDFNICHNEIDLTHPKECKNKSVFLPIEREAFSKILDVGYVDTFRSLYPDTKEYTWRSYLSRQDNFVNLGRQSYKYRIDYALCTPNLKFTKCEILDLEYSDHLPVVLHFDA